MSEKKKEQQLHRKPGFIKFSAWIQLAAGLVTIFGIAISAWAVISASQDAKGLINTIEQDQQRITKARIPALAVEMEMNIRNLKSMLAMKEEMKNGKGYYLPFVTNVFYSNPSGFKVAIENESINFDEIMGRVYVNFSYANSIMEAAIKIPQMNREKLVGLNESLLQMAESTLLLAQGMFELIQVEKNSILNPQQKERTEKDIK